MERDAQTDGALATDIRAGDERAFDVLMSRHQRAILNFLARLLGNAHAAQDAAQETFIRAYRGILAPGFKAGSAPLSAWIFQIARHVAIDRLRHRRRHPVESLEAFELAEGAIAASGRSADAAAASNEVGSLIAEAVLRLPEDQRSALILSEYEGLPDAEIAAIMQCSRKAVETRLYRARLALRTRLAHLLPPR